MTLNEQQFGYMTGHVAPGPDPDFARSSMHDPADVLPDYPRDLKTATHWYGTPTDIPMTAESHSAIVSALGHPEAPVRVYRALPRQHTEINPGDWVTPSRRYAQQHAISNGEDTWHVIHKDVKAKELFSEGDMHEWGYHPST